MSTSVKALSISVDSWASLAEDHPTWCSKITTGSRAAEKSCIAEAERKHSVRSFRPEIQAPQLLHMPPCVQQMITEVMVIFVAEG